MKITKYGTVTISEEGAHVHGFTFDAEGESLTLEDFGIAACEWAMKRIEAEITDIEIIVGQGNTRNGVPL